MNCLLCGHSKVYKHGRTEKGYQRYRSFMSMNLVFFFVGIGCLILSVKMRSNTLAFLTRTISTEGRVIEWQMDDEGFSYPIVEFIDSQGKIVKFTSTTGYQRGFKQGQKVKVVYNRNNSDAAEIPLSINPWLSTVLVAILGGLLIYFSADELLKGKTREEYQEKVGMTFGERFFWGDEGSHAVN